MSDLGLLWLHVRHNNRAFWRNPAAAFFTLVLPLMFLVMFSLLFGNQRTVVDGRSVSSATFTLSGILTFSVIGACYTSLAIGMTAAREEGFLKRVRGTPVAPWVYMGARLVHSMGIAILLVVVSVTFSAVAYGVRVPTSSAPALLVSLMVGAASFAALGLAVTAAIPNVEAAPAVVNAVIFPLLFSSNVFIPIARPPAWLKLVTGVFPVKPFAAALQRPLFAGPHASGFAPGDLLVLGLWGVVGLALALRFFSWEPRQLPA